MKMHYVSTVPWDNEPRGFGAAVGFQALHSPSSSLPLGEGGMWGHTKMLCERSLLCLSCRLWRTNDFCAKQPPKLRLELAC